MRRRKHRKHSHDVPHVDEKWLVSYADMMTLLFGLFVMLYSFALKNKSVAETVERELKKISEKGFNSSQLEADQLSEDLREQDLKKIISHLKKEMLTLQDQLGKAQEEISMRDLNSERLEKDLLNTQVQSVAAIRKAMQEAQARVPASVTGSGEAVAKSVMVYIKWTNRNHDIDLSVYTPDKLEINFKNRKPSSNDPDEFVTDSSKGPGVEMFKTADAKPGSYEFQISLYNSRGDESDSEVQLFAMIGGKETLLEKFLLKDAEGKRTLIKRIDLKNLKL